MCAVTTEAGQRETFDAVVLTMPPPQILELCGTLQNSIGRWPTPQLPGRRPAAVLSSGSAARRGWFLHARYVVFTWIAPSDARCRMPDARWMPDGQMLSHCAGVFAGILHCLVDTFSPSVWNSWNMSHFHVFTWHSQYVLSCSLSDIMKESVVGMCQTIISPLT